MEKTVPGRRSSRRPLLPGSGPLSRVPAVVPFLVVIALFAGGVLLSGPAGAVLLGVLALLVLGMLAATWSALAPGQRVLRIVILVVLLAVVVTRMR